ncbi:hypothetical protein [Rhizobium cauense]|uniref:hypothetical protein n=1 Tax=Rhizobium cauense TaxID=1166683 RepID=UPI0030B9068A
MEKLRRLADDLENIDRCVDAIEPKAVLTSWALGTRPVPCLVGRPLGHPIIADGRPACSSELFYLDPERGIARTMSRWYGLGARVEPEYWEERSRTRGKSFGDSH